MRHDQNVLTVSGLEADYDGEAMPFAEAGDRLESADIAFCGHTTPSSTPDRPRWRLLLPLAKEAPASDRARLMNGLNGLLGGGLSRESWVLSQCFSYGEINGPPVEAHLGGAERCIDEVDLDAIALPYRPVAGAGGARGAAPDFDAMDEGELLDVIHRGTHFWRPAKRLLSMWARQGVSEGDAANNLTSAFDAVPQAARGKKWA